MEQANNYLKWIKTNHVQFIRNPLQYLPSSAATNPTCDDSWEEQAFLEDAAGALGGCVWPPRSYSCTFCRREFRSAQALGGHMNVHRRDRARLKQSPNSNNEIRIGTHDHSYQSQLDQSSIDPSLVFHQYPSHNRNQIATLLCIPHPNSHGSINIAPSNSPTSSPNSRVSGALSPPNNNQDQKNLFPLRLSSSLIDKERYSERDHEESKYVEDDLSISLSIVSRTRPSSSSSEDDKEEEVMRSKRRKTDASTIPFFLEPQSLVDVESNHTLRISPCVIEEPDLELRLGY